MIFRLTSGLVALSILTLGHRAASASAAVREWGGGRSSVPQAQSPPPGRICGTVFTSAGRAADQANVSVVNEMTVMESAMALTDESGEFCVSVGQGNFVLTASRAGFLPTVFGVRAPRDRPLAIAVRAGQTVTVQVRLQEGHTIAGLVTGRSGSRLVGRSIVAYRITTLGPDPRQRSLVNAASGVTNDRGRFSLPPVSDGDYLIAVLPGTFFPAVTETGSAIQGNGRLTDTYEVPFFFPNTTNPSLAIPIEIRGSTPREITMSLLPVPTHVVKGMVVTASGSPVPGASVSLSRIGLPETLSVGRQSAVTKTDGTFSMMAVAAGDYVLKSTAPAGSTVQGSSEELISVLGDVLDRQVVQQTGVTVSGKISDEVDPKRRRVKVVLRASAGVNKIEVPVDFSGAFSARNVPPGDYELTFLSLEGPGIALPTARVVRSASFASGQLQVRDTNIEDVTVTLADWKTTISGQLLDQSGNPNSDFLVIVFSERLDVTGGVPCLLVVRPALDGSFKFESLPPDSYRIAVAGSADHVAAGDLAKILSPTSVALRLREGDRLIQNLKIVDRQPRP